jgi:hypothetical protein
MSNFYEQIERKIKSQRLQRGDPESAVPFNIDYKHLPKKLKPLAKLLEPLVKGNAQLRSGGFLYIRNENQVVKLSPDYHRLNVNVIVIPFYKYDSLVIGYFDRGNAEENYFLLLPGHERYQISLSKLKDVLAEELGRALVNLGHLDKATYSKKVQDIIEIE